MDLDVTSPKQLNRRLFLKQLAVDLCTSEWRILFRAQYVRENPFYLLPNVFHCTQKYEAHCQLLARALSNIHSA